MSYLDKLDESQREIRRSQHRYYSDARNWDPGKQERHRKMRALHELMDWLAYPGYTIRTDGEKLYVKPREVLTAEARKHMGMYRQELIDWLREHEPMNAQGESE